MTEATAAFGGPLAVPSTSAVQPSDVGPIWKSGGSSGTGSSAAGISPATVVAITFPSKGILVEYSRPVPDPGSDQASSLRGLSAEIASSKVVQLDGTTPALYIPENSDRTGVNFGVILFETNGTEVRVLGHNDEATLEAIAQSILAQSNSPSS